MSDYVFLIEKNIERILIIEKRKTRKDVTICSFSFLSDVKIQNL